MEAVLTISITLTFILLAGLYTFIRNKLIENKNLRKTAEELHLDYKKGILLIPPSIKGIYKSFSVLIRHHYKYKNKKTYYSYIVKLKGSLSEFMIRSETKVTKAADALWINEFKTSDTKFDELFFLKAVNIPQLAGLLNKETRSAITGLKNNKDNKYYFNITNDAINIELPGNIKENLDKIISAAELICRSGSTIDHLIENYLNETNVKIKYYNLRYLFDNFLNFDRKQEIIERALMDKSPEINVLALQQKKEVRYKELDKIWEKAPEHLRMDLVQFISWMKDEVKIIKKYYRSAKSNSLKLKILGLLEFHGFPKLNDFLVEILEKEKSMKIQNKILTALGNSGTVEAVEPLLRIKNIILIPPAKQAITKIQSRLGPADRGSLTLNEESKDSGSLSISDDKDKT